MKVIAKPNQSTVVFSNVPCGDLFRFLGKQEICVRLNGGKYASVRDGMIQVSRDNAICEVCKQIECQF